jgi:hypothetical protein
MSCFDKKWMSCISYPLFLCLILLGPASPSTAQNTWQFDQQDLSAYHQLLALKAFDQELILSRDRVATRYLAHFQNSIALLVSDNNDALDDYEQSTNDLLDYLKKQKGDSPYIKFYTAEVLLQSAFIHLKLGHELSAGWELRRAYREIRRNSNQYPAFLPQYKTIGLLHIIIGSVPDKYNWLLSLLGMEGSVVAGLEELKLLANSENVYRTEAQLLILLMQGYVLSETDASIQGLHQLHDSDPDNLLTGYLYVSVLMKSQKNKIALQVLDTLTHFQNPNYIRFSLLTYLKAEAQLQKGDYLAAIANYQKFNAIHSGNNYLKDASYKCGLAHWLLDQADSATLYFDKARNMGVTLTEVDKHADKQLKNDPFVNRKIMRARLLTDGGYYDKALNTLDKIRSSELAGRKDEIELNYRKARIYHQTDKVNAAIAFYKLTINSSAKNNWYFAPNAALQLGFIYWTEDNKYLAEKYFKKALSYKDHEYKNSIDNKAKSALSKLEDQ